MKGSHLAIQISNFGVKFTSLRNEMVVHSHDHVFEGNEIGSKKEQLESHLKESNFLRDDFDEVTLSWSGNKSTIVPNNIFAESSAEAIFKLCFGKDIEVQSVDYNRIAELSVINVFEIPTWVKQFFVLKFPRIVLQHEGSHLLRKVMSNSTFKLKATIVLYDNYFQMIIVKHGNLEFYSYFDYQNFEDVIYHALFTLQQKELTDEKGKIELIQGLGAQIDIQEKVIDSIKRIKDLNKLDTELCPDFIEKAQLLCV